MIKFTKEESRMMQILLSIEICEAKWVLVDEASQEEDFIKEVNLKNLNILENLLAKFEKEYNE